MRLGCGFNARFGWGSLGGKERELTQARQGVGYLEGEYELERPNLTDIAKWFLASPTLQLEHVAGSMETPGPLAKALIDPRLPPGPPGLTHVLPLSATLSPLSIVLHTVLPCGNLDDLLSTQKP